jgi:hypothetical protein
MRTVHAVPSRPWLVQIDMALGSWMQTSRLRPR